LKILLIINDDRVPFLSFRYRINQKLWFGKDRPGHQSLSAGFCENFVEHQIGNPAEMLQVTGYKFQIVADGSRGNLNIRPYL